MSWAMMHGDASGIGVMDQPNDPTPGKCREKQLNEELSDP
jgi:hypothetical protein